MDFKNYLETSWRLTLQYIVPLILLTLVLFGLIIFTLGILAPVAMAGYMQSILFMLRDGREPKLQDLFSQMNLFLPLLGFGFVVFIATTVGFILLLIPGVLVILGVSFTCIYMLPLMTDQKLGLIDAIKTSYAMSMKGSIADHVVMIIIFLGIVMIGNAVFIGSLFTKAGKHSGGIYIRFTRVSSSLVTLETFEKCLILFKFKAGEDFNHRHTLSISRIKI